MRIYDFGEGPVVISEYPELTKELPELLKELGLVESIEVPEMRETHPCVLVRLNHPATVLDWRKEWGKGVSINSSTNYSSEGGVGFSYKELPNPGDLKVSFRVQLELDSRFVGYNKHSADYVRDAIRSFARRANIDWFYHF